MLRDMVMKARAELVACDNGGACDNILVCLTPQLPHSAIGEARVLGVRYQLSALLSVVKRRC